MSYPSAWQIVTGTKNAGATYDFSGGFRWRIESNNIATNSTTFTIQLWAARDGVNGLFNSNSLTSYAEIDNNSGTRQNITTSYNLYAANTTRYTKYYCGTDTAQFTRGNSVTFTVTHNADGTRTVPVHTRWTATNNPYLDYIDTVSTITLDTIPRASSIVSLTNPTTIGTNPTLTIAVNSSTFTHRIHPYVNGIQIGEIQWAAGVTSAALDLSSVWAPILNNMASGDTTYSYSIYLGTYSADGSTLIGSWVGPYTVTASTKASNITTFASFNIATGNMSSVVSKGYNNTSIKHRFVYTAGVQTLHDSGYTDVSSYSPSMTDTIKGYILGQIAANQLSTSVKLSVSTYYYNGSTYKQIGATQESTVTASITRSTATMTDFTLEHATSTTANPQITVTTQSTLLNHKITSSIGAYTGPELNLAAGVTTGQITINAASIYAVLWNTTTGTYNAVIQTYYGTTPIGTGYNFNSEISMIPANIAPTISAVTFYDNNSIARNTGLWVALKSIPQITVTAAGNKSATIQNYSISFDGVNKTTNPATFSTLASVASATNKAATVTVTDSRGQPATNNSYTINVQPYSSPLASISTVERSTGAVKNPFGTDLLFKTTATSTSLVNVSERNSLDVKYWVKLKDTTTWYLLYDATNSTATPPAISNTSYYSSYNAGSLFSVDLAFDAKIELIDIFETVPILFSISTGQIPLALTQIGAGIGKIPADGTTYNLEVGSGGIKSDGPFQASNLQIKNLGNIDLNTVLTTGMYRVNIPTNKPSPSNNYGQLLVVMGGEDTYSQMYYDYGNGNVWTRSGTHSGGTITTGTWAKIWTSINSGDGSGLDADTLDGNHASAFAPTGHTHSFLSGASYIQSTGLSTSWGVGTGTNKGAFNAIMGTASSATWLLSGSSGGVFRAGIQALDSNGILRFYAGSNYLQYDGTSSGEIWHSGNDGAGSGLDADLLDGYGSDTSATANSIVRRDANSYIYANYYNSSRGEENTAASHYLYENNSDGWIRKKSLANVKTEILGSNRFDLLWSGTLSAAGNAGTLNSAYTNYHFLIVTGYMDNGNSENMVPTVIPTGVIGTNARQFSLNHSFTSSSISWLNFHFSNSTTIYVDSVSGAYTETIRAVYGVRIP